MDMIKRLLLERVTEHSFKAVFLIAPPATGKTTIIQSANLPSDTYIITPDPVYERAAALNEPISERSAKTETEAKLVNAIMETAPILVETIPGSTRTVRRMAHLQSIGYDIGVVIITPDITTEELIARAEDRAKKTGRTVDSDVIKNSMKELEDTILNVKREIPDVTVTSDVQKASQQVSAYYNQPLKNTLGKEKINRMKQDNLDNQYPELMSERDFQYIGYAWYSK